MRKSQAATLFGFGVSLLALSAAQTANAQSSNNSDEIVVTAERRESRLLDTPLAVAAIPSQQLERQNIASLEDVQAVTPSLTFGTFSNYAIVSMRGVGTDFGTISAEPAVATFQDGVYLGASSSQNVPGFDLERIEVLRGPQGTLYGRNSTGGAINFITRQPSFTPEANAAVVVGDYDRVGVDFGVSGPVTGTTSAGRLSARYESRSGYRDNIFTGGEADDLESKSVAGSFLVRPNDAVDITLRADYTNRDTSVPYARIADSLGFNTLLGGSFVANPDETTDIRNDTPTWSNFEVWGASGTVEIDVGSATLRSITAYRDNTFVSQEDWDGSDGFLVQQNAQESTGQFTQEFNLFGSAFDNRLDWLIGAFYYDADGELFFHYTGDALSLAGATSLDFDVTQESTSTAFFGQATYHLTDRLNLTAGVRQTHDEKTMEQNILFNGALNVCGVTTSDSWNATTGTLSLDYHFTPDAMIYGRVSRGFKAGGINAGDCADTFDPEYVTAYETGVRGSALGGVLRGAITAFYYDYTDIQFSTFNSTSATLDNVGGARVQGIELEFNFRPRESHFQADGSVSYLDSEYEDDLIMDPFLTGPYQIGGNQLVRAPEWRGNIGAQYAFSIGGGELILRGETSYSDEYYHDVFNGKAALQAETLEPSYTISNLRLIWAPESGDYEVQAFVENIEDNMYAYRRFAASTFGGITGAFSPPRTFGVRVSAQFGE